MLNSRHNWVAHNKYADNQGKQIQYFNWANNISLHNTWIVPIVNITKYNGSDW
jgi:hypothetical protein